MAKKSKEPTTLPLPISASDDLEDEGPTPYLRADAPASYKSWDTDWARVFRESGPCMVTLRPIGHDLATSIDAKQAELGKARGRTWIACVSEAPMTLRVSYLLKAGFTADEIHSLGLCSLADGGERSYGPFRNGDDYRQEKARVARADADFMKLPSWIRARFKNDPVPQLIASPIPKTMPKSLRMAWSAM